MPGMLKECKALEEAKAARGTGQVDKHPCTPGHMGCVKVSVFIGVNMPGYQ